MTTMLSHRPVLLNEVVTMLAPPADAVIIDATLGLAGHAAALLEAAGPNARLLGIDQDASTLEIAARDLARFGDRATCVHGRFDAIADLAEAYGFVPATTVLLDLGISSAQLDDPERGFSFHAGGPLDMRMDRASDTTAADIVNGLEETELADLIWRLGEERRSRRIARAIVAHRPITTTGELAEIIRSAAPSHPGAIHPATRTFQAIRIAVNDELGVLHTALAQIPGILAPGGRVGVIAFHSLEDRIVKEFFRTEARDCVCGPEVPVCVCGHRATLRIVNRHVVQPGPEEVRANPRARSARLRVAERLPAAGGEGR